MIRQLINYVQILDLLIAHLAEKAHLKSDIPIKEYKVKYNGIYK